MSIDNPRPTVVFIGGAGRSGTTLLDCLLGQHQGVFSAGELAHIWERGGLGNQLCGCGEPFLKCSFWSAVMEEGFNSSNYEEFRRLRQAVERVRYIPYYYLNREPNNPALPVYKELLSALYIAICKVSGARIVIDSSKEPPHGFLVAATPGIDAKLIHMVRDSRAVAFSWTRRRIRPEVHWKTQYMPRAGILRSAFLWNYYNLSTETLRMRMKDWRLVKYEELVASPSTSIETLLLWLRSDKDFVSRIDSDGVTDIKGNHSVAGNPSRFVTGRLQIRKDEEWKTSMSRRDRAAVMVLTFPLLVKYYWTKGKNPSE